jgi:hypothetical protein
MAMTWTTGPLSGPGRPRSPPARPVPGVRRWANPGESPERCLLGGRQPPAAVAAQDAWSRDEPCRGPTLVASMARYSVCADGSRTAHLQRPGAASPAPAAIRQGRLVGSKSSTGAPIAAAVRSKRCRGPSCVDGRRTERFRAPPERDGRPTGSVTQVTHTNRIRHKHPDGRPPERRSARGRIDRYAEGTRIRRPSHHAPPRNQPAFDRFPATTAPGAAAAGPVRKQGGSLS